MKLVPVNLIDPSPFAHLVPPDPANQAGLRDDMDAHRGEILNPLHAIKKDDGRWELLAGHDRLEAAKAAGLTEVPVRDFSGMVGTDEEKVSHVGRDNIRKDIDPRPLIRWWFERHPDWSIRQVRDQVGCSVGVVHATKEEMRAEGKVFTANTLDRRTGKPSHAATKPRTPAPPVRRKQKDPDPPGYEPPDDMTSKMFARPEAEARTTPSTPPEPAPEPDSSTEEAGTSGAGIDRSGAEGAGGEALTTEPSQSERDMVRGQEERTQRGNTYNAIGRLVYFADTVRGPKNIEHAAALLTEHPEEFYQDQRRRPEDVIAAAETVIEWLPRFVETIKAKLEEKRGSQAA